MQFEVCRVRFELNLLAFLVAPSEHFRALLSSEVLGLDVLSP